MPIRGNGKPFGTIRGAYYNPLQIFPFLVFVSGPSADMASSSATNTIDVTPEAGDEVYAHVAVGGTVTPSITPPAGEGWQLLANASDDSNITSTTAAIYFKRWGDGSIDTTTVTFVASSGTTRLVLVVVRGASADDDPTGNALDGATNAGSATLVAPSVEAPQHALLLRFYEGTLSYITPAVGSLYGGPAYLGTVGADIAGACSATDPISGSTPAAFAMSNGTPPVGWNTVSLGLAGVDAPPVVEEFTACSANVMSESATNTLLEAPIDGDILIAHCFLAAPGGGNPTVTAPAGEGWQTDENFLQSFSVTGIDNKIAVFWKRWGSGDIDNTTVTFSSAPGANLRLVLLNVRGCVASGPPYVTEPASGSDSSGHSMSVLAPALPVNANTLAMRFYACSANDPVSLLAPMNRQYSYSWTAGHNTAMAFSTQVIPTARTLSVNSASSDILTTGGWVGCTVGAPGVSL